MWHVMPSHLLAFDFFEVARDDGRTGRHSHKEPVVEAETLNCTVDEDCDIECDIEDGTMNPPPP